ncbi:hypothetical protein M9H77_25876 [Catharanthus roseus]|uniref:Uncharacterized protein n=1 Tax=Catharanthus roseus TaxID=4058 RepID=A0ACC0ACC6_CATRO|nr:hypothetical protein M9H77_25876 [Catharanthus roseus]
MKITHDCFGYPPPDLSLLSISICPRLIVRRAMPNAKSLLIPGLYMASMLCPPVSVVIPPKLDPVQVKMSITCIWYMLSPCKLADHMPGIVVLHCLITDEAGQDKGAIQTVKSKFKINKNLSA